MPSVNFRQGARINQAQAVGNINTPIPDFGGELIDDTAAHVKLDTDPIGWAHVYTLTSTVFNAATKSNFGNLGGKTIPAGVWIHALFSVIQLTSGSVLAHKATD